MFKKLLFTLPLFILFSCYNEQSEIPDVYIDEYIYLANPENINLQSPNGWTYSTGGIKGLIIYRLNSNLNDPDNNFVAYDRSCPHISQNGCSVLNIEKDIIAKCECDESEFLLTTGEPLNGAHIGLKKYKVYYNPNNETLHIVN
ncbi:MAG: hypothetical protein KAG96_05440 [Ichthyobacteriaceae bacterium]|nr:hypothetical protein [Ichthyobacteriaceae bacterium]